LPACEGVETEGATVKIAAPPAQLLPKTMASATLLACLLTAKYVDGLPFYRQEKQFTRIGVDLSRATMSNWAIRLADRCKPLWEMMQKESRSGPVIQIDETTIQVMREKGRANQTKSYMWVMRGGPPDAPVVIFQYEPGRAGAFVKAWLGDYRGVVQTDGYRGYNFLDEEDGVAHAACMAHVRRKFAEVCKIGGKKRKPGLADQAVSLLKKLYKVEKEARDHALPADAIYQLRQEKSKPVIEDFEKWLDKYESRIPPKGALGNAIGYAIRQRKRLRVFLDNGHVAIDNNRVENDIRPFVVGRKNWLFAGKPEGAEASAIWYSLIETAKANGWEPFAYLTFLFNGLLHAQTEADYEALLPNRTTT
jgi:transposase